jgi:hypothetical protein
MSTRWVPKLLSMAQKDERVQRSTDLIQLLQKQLLVVLNNIVTMDEPAVSFYTPETKQQSKQWVKNSQPALLKAKVHASRTKQMVLVFFDAKGVIYTNLVPKGKTVSFSYILTVLARFLRVFKEKRPIMLSQEYIEMCYWWNGWN